MKKLTLLFLPALLLLNVSSAFAEKPSSDDMLRLLKVSGTVEVINQINDQIMSNTMMRLKQAAPELPPAAYNAVTEEIKSSLDMWVKNITAKQMKYYSERLTKAEVLKVISIYESPEYQKVLNVGQQFIDEEFQPLLQNELPALTQEMMTNIQKRLKDEGYLDKKGGGA